MLDSSPGKGLAGSALPTLSTPFTPFTPSAPLTPSTPPIPLRLQLVHELRCAKCGSVSTLDMQPAWSLPLPLGESFAQGRVRPGLRLQVC